MLAVNQAGPLRTPEETSEEALAMRSVPFKRKNASQARESLEGS